VEDEAVEEEEEEEAGGMRWERLMALIALRGERREEAEDD